MQKNPAGADIALIGRRYGRLGARLYSERGGISSGKHHFGAAKS
jgi:hypothetical protein